jgi:hypothetical protein
MSQPNSDPQSTAAILGGQSPAPLQGAILGGVEGIRQKLANVDLAIRLEALEQAWGYGAVGLPCLQQALSDRSKVVRRRARWILRQSEGAQLSPMPPLWDLTERVEESLGYAGGYATCFANRTVQEFESGQALQNPQQVAYALRSDYEAHDIGDRLEALLETAGSEQIEALVLGAWGDSEGVCTGDETSKGLVELLASLRDRLPNLKALFIGDITSEECEISWMQQSDISPILQAFSQLEVLQVRGGEGLEFNPTLGISRHENLKALILETGGLSPQTVHQIYEWDFPALEHLELWLGSESYGGTCKGQDLQPLLEDLKFPNLLYLGLCNSQFADEIAEMVVRSRVLEGLQVLDLSLSTLGDQGAEKLLECPAIQDLETLNVSQCYLSGAMIDRLRSLEIEVLAAEQREEEDDEDPSYRRYCVVSE